MDTHIKAHTETPNNTFLALENKEIKITYSYSKSVIPSCDRKDEITRVSDVNTVFYLVIEKREALEKYTNKNSYMSAVVYYLVIQAFRTNTQYIQIGVTKCNI